MPCRKIKAKTNEKSNAQTLTLTDSFAGGCFEQIHPRKERKGKECGGELVAEWKSTQIYRTMYLGKFIEEQMTLVECEGGHEVGGNRTEEELRQGGYKNACLVEKPSETAVETWQEYGDCFVQVWHEEEEPTSDITDSEALQIITEGE